MRYKVILYLAFLCGIVPAAKSQNIAMSFERAVAEGKAYQQLDSSYRSAVHTNPALAVFKTPEEQENFRKAYAAFIGDLASFLKSKNFEWEKQTRCFNRIYFDSDGTVDYFLYNFPAGQLEPEKEKEFDRLLNLFIQNHSFSLTANENFAQCSPIKYTD